MRCYVMKKNRFFLACLLLAFLCGCDYLLRLSGKVIDENGKPIPGAKVWMIYGNWVSESQTNQNGEFRDGIVHGGNENLSLLISKEGKQLYFQTLNYEEKEMKITVTLKNGTQSMLQTPEHQSKP